MANYQSPSDSKGYYIKLIVDQVSQNTSGNSSQVRARLVLHNTLTTFAQYRVTASLVVNGQTYSYSGHPSLLGNYSSVTLIDRTVTVAHENDGSKSFSVRGSLSGSGGYSPDSLSTSGSFKLGTIARASTVSLGSGVIGQTVAVTISRQATSFTHTLRYAFGSKSGTIASNVGTSHNWTIPSEFSAEIPNSTSGSGTVYVDTYNGSTKIGTQQASFTVTVPDSLVPTLSGVNLSDGNATTQRLVPSGEHFVQILSDIVVQFAGASGVSGSQITGYQAELVGKNQSTSANGGRLGMMNYSGQVTVRAWVTDSRGRRSRPVEKSVTVLPYFAPTLTLSASRAGEGQNQIVVNRSAMIAPLSVNGSQKNQATLVIKVARLGTTAFQEAHRSGLTGGGRVGPGYLTLSGSYPPHQAFEVVAELSDAFNRVSFQATVSAESVVMSYDKDGRVGIGKPADDRLPAGSLDVAGDVQARNGVPIGFYARNRISDLDKALTSGVYYFNKGCLNQPSFYDTWGYVEVVVSHSHEHNNQNNWIWQTYQTTSGHLFTRYKVNSDPWSDWIVPGLNQFYPIGSIYQSTSSTDPATLMGGRWERFGKGRVLVGVDEDDGDFNTANKPGGSKVTDNFALSGTGYGGLTGGKNGGEYNGQVFVTNNSDKATTNGRQKKPQSILQPYVTVYMWRRVD